MNTTMIVPNVSNISDLEKFVADMPKNTFSSASKKEAYEWVKNILTTFSFRDCKRKDRGKIRKYIQTITGYSVSQITRLVEKYLLGKLTITPYKRCSFSPQYSPADIALLCTTDNAHSRLNGHATKKILEREYGEFGHLEYANISRISVSQLYRLRSTRIYQSKSLTYSHTQAVKRNIGERRKPVPNGRPGYIRIDTVHQGDNERQKGVYHINSVDEVTQWEIVASVEKITEIYLEPILLLMIEQYPFIIIEFHADNGSEYINYTIADLLNKLLIKLTKSRSRQSNDNALVESKNGSIIQKHMGYFYIHQKYAPQINDFYMQFFNPYLNFHRPCGFATTTSSSFLKPGVSFIQLDTLSKQHSDNEYATIMETEKQKLFEKIGGEPIDF